MGLPMLRLEIGQASPEAVARLLDPIQLQRTISAHRGLQNETETIRIEGVKTAPRIIVKVFLDREQSVQLLRERPDWLQALHGVKIQGEQWHPISWTKCGKRTCMMHRDKKGMTFGRNFHRIMEVQISKWSDG
jgi:hypothetical protein